MAKKFVPVQKSPGEMTTEEIRAWLGDLPDSEVMRSILKAEIDAIRAGADREERTLRGLWYDTVKPLLSRAGILNNKTRGGKPVEWDAKLSSYMIELVRMGVTSYEEMRIVDGSRQRQPARAISIQPVEVQMIGDHYPWVILFTEKDTIWPIVEGVANLYGVSAISGGGQPSGACTENTVREIVRGDSFRAACPHSIIILALSDYDPSGYSIAQSQFEQVQEVVNALPPGEAGGVNVRIDRIGLYPSQLTQEERQANAYTPKDNGLDQWYQETGGVDGQPLGLELDALPLSRIRRMFAEGIEQVIDLEKRRQDLRDSLVDLLACDLLLPDFEAKRAAMIKAVKSNGLWRQIEQATLPDNLFIRLAEAGANWITPDQTKQLYRRFVDQVIETMQREP